MSHTHSYNVRDFGAVGDGHALDTRSIQAAIDTCAAQGGGTVFVPAGRYVTGSLFLRSQITLYLDAGATLLGSEDPADYPIIEGRWEGRTQPTHAPLISGQDLTTIALAGRGTIDGRGAYWWRRHKERTLDYPRPRLVSFMRCANVLIEGITAINSPSWTITPAWCDNVTIHQITIRNPAESPNTDGINPDSCSNVHISDCHISVGDDCITIKSGIETELPERRRPCSADHDHQLHYGRWTRRRGDRQRDERRCAQCRDRELRVRRHRPRHPAEVAARSRRRGRRCARDQCDHDRCAVPVHHESVLCAGRLGRCGGRRQAPAAGHRTRPHAFGAST